MKHKTYKKVVLVVLDGFGVAHKNRGNAVTLAKTPNMTKLIQTYPVITLQASGPLVGLPWAEMGNSEVGHLNMGAGRIAGQDLTRITNAIRSGEFFKNKVFLQAFEHTKKHSSALHIMGMVSPGGVHSLDEHIYALLSMASDAGLKNVFIHMFTDGRDTAQKVALDSLLKLDKKIEEIGVGKVATVAGRFYAMDRGKHWKQTEAAYNAMVEGRGEIFPSPAACITKNYSEGIFDEMIKPSVITDTHGVPVGKISDNDAVIFINFRQDRAIQLTQAFVQAEKFAQEMQIRPLQNLFFATMTEYLPGLKAVPAFLPADLKNCLSDVVSASGLRQFHIAESEKYAHVTVFFNCGRAEKLPGEEWLIVTSPENSRNYVDHPEMSAKVLTDKLVEKILEKDMNFCVANYANGDMVGHTGHLQSSVEAVEYLDVCMGRVSEACLKAGAFLIITADHGNCEYMLNPNTGEINPDHTTNPIPCFFIAEELVREPDKKKGFDTLATEVPSGVISDIAPTVLSLLGLKKPEQMTGADLLSLDEGAEEVV